VSVIAIVCDCFALALSSAARLRAGGPVAEHNRQATRAALQAMSALHYCIERMIGHPKIKRVIAAQTISWQRPFAACYSLPQLVTESHLSTPPRTNADRK
jgi:hypothetical protein